MEQTILREVAKSVLGVTLRNGLKLQEEGALPVLQPKDIEEGLRQPLYLEEWPPSAEKHLLKKGDILLANKGLKFSSGLFSRDYPCIAAASLFVIRVNRAKCLPEYLLWYLQQPEAKNHFRKNSLTSTIPSLNKAALDHLPLFVPPIEVQVTIVGHLAFLQRQEKILTEMLVTISELRSASIWELINPALNG
jgi:restriction endonuclease S subunit